MFKREKRITGSEAEVSNYIYGYDVYDSKLLYSMSNPNLTRTLYTINRYEYRPDLIAKEFYGTSDYMALVILQTGMSLDEFTKGTVLRLLPKATIDSLIKSLF